MLACPGLPPKERGIVLKVSHVGNAFGHIVDDSVGGIRERCAGDLVESGVVELEREAVVLADAKIHFGRKGVIGRGWKIKIEVWGERSNRVICCWQSPAL